MGFIIIKCTFPKKAIQEPKGWRRVPDVYTSVYIYLTLRYKKTLHGDWSGLVFIEYYETKQIGHVKFLQGLHDILMELWLWI